MGLSFLVNFVLLAIPIGSTLGVVLGINWHRASMGQKPLFEPETPNGPNGGPAGPNAPWSPDNPTGKPPKLDNGIKIEYHCNRSLWIEPLTKGDPYMLNPNPWGWDKGDPGSICMNVTTFNNQSYPTKSSVPEWSVTWQYPVGPLTQPVHAYPNVKVQSKTLPAQIRNIQEINVDFEWTYAVGDTAKGFITDEASLSASSVNTNVALDMFLDTDKKKALSYDDAGMEIMIWFAAFGPGTHPIGFTQQLDSVKMQGIDFKLFAGKNDKRQSVLTWYTYEPATKFHGDLIPLIHRLIEAADDPFVTALLPLGSDVFPTKNHYIGYMGFGTEAYHSKDEVTFHVPELAIDVNTGELARERRDD